MQISSNHTRHNPSFQKRASTRKADDIVRQVRNNYPAVSLSNILENWKRPYKPANKEEDEKWKRSLRRLDYVLDYIREDGRLSPKNPIFEEQVTKIKRFKAANCAEYAYLSLATLYANGYNKSNCAYPAIQVDFLDRNDKTVFTYKRASDHVAVHSFFDEYKEYVVLDAWLGKAMSAREAIEQYKIMYYEKDKEAAIKEATKAFRKSLPLLKRINFKLDDYTIKTKIEICADENRYFSPEEAKYWGEVIVRQFPEMVIKDK